jgi:hypothetical protein
VLLRTKQDTKQIPPLDEQHPSTSLLKTRERSSQP